MPTFSLAGNQYSKKQAAKKSASFGSNVAHKRTATTRHQSSSSATKPKVIRPEVVEIAQPLENPHIEGDSGKKITKNIGQLTGEQIDKDFKPHGLPSYDQKRILLGGVPVSLDVGTTIPNFIDWDNLPKDAMPPEGLVYKNVKFDAAPDGIQKLYRRWLSEFRNGMSNAKGEATLNFLIAGPPGTGKTEGLRFLAQDAHLPFWNIQGESLDPMALFGAWTQKKGGESVFEEGTLVQAIRHGGILLFDELNAFPQDVQIRLNSLLDDRRTLYLRETGEMIKANPELVIFATMNPPGGGTHDLIPQLKSRFQKRLWFPLPPEDQQLEIVKTRLQLPEKRYEDIEDDLQKAVSLVRKLGQMEDLPYHPTIREVMTMGRDLSSGESVKESLISDFLDIYYDPENRQAVAETINSVFGGRSHINA